MASIIDSFREVYSDRFSFLKIIIWSIPVYYSYQIYLQSKGDFSYFYMVAGLTAFFLFGFMIKVSGNAIKDGDKVLPFLNLASLAVSAGKGLVSIGPAAFIMCFLANFACSMINVIAWFDSAVESIIWAIVLSAIVTSYLMFVENERVIDAFNMRILFQKAGDLIVIVAIFVLQLIIMNFITAGFLGYLINLLFGQGPVFNFFLAIVLVFNIGVVGHYLGQLHFDTIGYHQPTQNEKTSKGEKSKNIENI